MSRAGLSGLALAVGLAIGSAAAAQGIGAEEFARLRPQAPRDVAVAARDDVARITWRQPTAAPEERLAYDRTIVRYRVYRLEGDRSRMIGETAGRTLTDRTGPPGPTTRYVVTTVQASGREGVRSEEAAAR